MDASCDLYRVKRSIDGHSKAWKNVRAQLQPKMRNPFMHKSDEIFIIWKNIRILLASL